MRRKQLLALGCALALCISGLVPGTGGRIVNASAAASTESKEGETGKEKVNSDTAAEPSGEDKKEQPEEGQTQDKKEDTKDTDKEKQDTNQSESSETKGSDKKAGSEGTDSETRKADAKNEQKSSSEEEIIEESTADSDAVTLFKQVNGDGKEKTETKEDYLDVSLGHDKLELEINKEFELTLKVSGGKPPYKIDGYYGPDWLKVDGITLSGKPTKAGVYLFSYTVSDANGKISWGLDAQIVVGGGDTSMPKVKLVTQENDTAVVLGEDFRFPIEISGGTAPYTIKLRGAPEWVKLENGALVGKATELSEGYGFGISVVDANGTESEMLPCAIKVVKEKQDRDKDKEKDKKDEKTIEASKDKKESTKDNKESSNTTNAVKTGDTAPIAILVVVLIAAGIGIVIFTKKKKKDNDQ
ncbi:LPXTG cell wall anchor domain-containing protein [Lactonifactor longoviformis]|uniref:LPXTG cell wall anchor domain-containing protein n=1 Tax=Lactonifactor TaxID=420345 RepID=UPI0012B0C261|nr:MULTISPECIES: LPXTG cell wall anchor domain-containing protein [Lactonifactor]MCQ4669991.1 LPXTG cell wall anchor domain-containing protein [Lactonifactor longoviformis]MSA03668.1 LPXTG cell wall anchor domain-containing protein [Lactonifactor sp. BIOML-A5]MSA07616.1 LPXTG cell wall anchor domain-containing protein [Lactonifactor sp. BIOML-A4]MSA14675.1 LPXTG cell wall anchor domain-containing protein [Lactonifactor sp. BIOML-A3]MSA19097.1 LPXTG cell wall anchor domain-containing protein [L